MMFIVLSLHLQLISTTMLFKQAYGFLLSIHLQVLVTTVRCLSKLTRHILPHFCVNKVNVSYGIFTLTNPLCHCHVTNFSYYPLTSRRSMLSQYSFSVFTEFLVIIVLCPTMSQLKVVATFINIMEKKKTCFIKKYIYSLVVKTL